MIQRTFIFEFIAINHSGTERKQGGYLVLTYGLIKGENIAICI